jgi:hypothetical protein
MEAITTVGCSGSCATEWSTFATLAAETESKPIKGNLGQYADYNLKKGIKPLTGSGFVQDEDVRKSDEL